MKNLGKILLILFVLPQTIFASVVASVDYEKVSLGEMVTLSLTLNGDDILRPNLYNICGSDIASTSSSTSIQIVNGDYQKNYVLSYKFMPKKSCTIESIGVDIDGTIEHTKPIEIKVQKTVASADSDFSLVLSANKKEVYVGEPFELTLLFKQKNKAEAVDSKFVPPVLNGFWVKEESKPTRTKNATHTITKIVYTMAPQREGELEITSAQMRIAFRSSSRDNWNSFIPQIKWKSYFSNELKIKAKPLPMGVKLVGNFEIEAEVNTRELNANEAVSVTLSVRGDGNLEDIQSFKPYVQGVSIFDEKISITNRVLTQKITFVGDENFVIPSFSLKFFNPSTQKIETIQTKEIAIKVNNSQPKRSLKNKEKDPPQREDQKLKETQ